MPAGQAEMPCFFISRHIVVRLTCISRAADETSPWLRASAATIISRSARSRAAATLPSCAALTGAARRHDFLGQVVEVDELAAGDGDRALDDVLELAHVAGILIRDERRRCGRGAAASPSRRRSAR